jgi:hypothetical protein
MLSENSASGSKAGRTMDVLRTSHELAHPGFVEFDTRIGFLGHDHTTILSAHS